MKVTGIFMLLFWVFQTGWSMTRFGERLCNNSHYTCITIKRGDSWAQMFPNAQEREIVQRVNRMNIFLQPDMVIAIPRNLSQITLNDVSPLPLQINSDGEKKIHVKLEKLAFGAYDENGQLIKWGPISPGTKICLDVDEGCQTPKGSFRVLHKKGGNCISGKFPKRINGIHGGGEMPYCVFFYHGFAFHGSSELPGYEASFGCLRLFIQDAQWLNEQFVDLPGKGNLKGTQVIIE